MNWHEIIDERKYEMHQVIAAVLRAELYKLDSVLCWIDRFLKDPEYSDHSKDALTEWRELIVARGAEGVIEALADRGEEAARMRQNSPFAILMPEDKRREILRRYETRRPRTPITSV